MKWNNSHKNPPTEGQKVYYFGPAIGIWIGTYKYQPRTIERPKCGDLVLCPHTFHCADNFGVVDACDAPYWLPYDETGAKCWVPMPPEEYVASLNE